MSQVGSRIDIVWAHNKDVHYGFCPRYCAADELHCGACWCIMNEDVDLGLLWTSGLRKPADDGDAKSGLQEVQCEQHTTKSQAQIWLAWLRRNVAQVCLDARGPRISLK